MPKFAKNKKATTLIELIFASIAVVFILLAIYPLIISGHKFLAQSLQYAGLQDDATIAIQHITKRANNANSIEWYSTDASRVDIHYVNPPTNTTVSYHHDVANSTVVFTDENSQTHIIAENITALTFTADASDEITANSDQYKLINISLTASKEDSSPFTMQTKTRVRVAKRLSIGGVLNLNTGVFFSSIDGAVNDILTTSGHNILVQEDTYTENLTMKDGVSIWGGYPIGFPGLPLNYNPNDYDYPNDPDPSYPNNDGDPLKPDDDPYRDPENHPAIIDGGNGSGPVIYCRDIANTSTIDGFTITNGRNSGGKGIICVDSSLTVQNNIITGNIEGQGFHGPVGVMIKGGGFAICGGSPTIQHNIISNNSGSLGAGIWIGNGATPIGEAPRRASPTIQHNTIIENVVSYSAGDTGRGGGICIWGEQSPVILGNTITGNKAPSTNEGAGCGGGIYCINSSSFAITNNIITENESARNGGGICCDNSSPTISNNKIIENTTGSGYAGGGIHCVNNSSPTISNNRITKNESSSGGGISCMNSSSTTITDNTIAKNKASHSGAGIDCHQCTSPITISGNRIVENSFIGGGGYNGGGIDFSGCSGTISNNIIASNEVANRGAGINCFSSSVTISNNIIMGNIASVFPHIHNLCQGGGIYSGWGPATISGNTIVGNEADDYGGGIFCTGTFADITSPLITSNLIAGNTGHNEGSGIACNYSSPTLLNNTIVNNSISEGIYFFTDTPPTAKNCIIWDNSGANQIKGVTSGFTYCDIEDGFTGTGNIDADPLFVDNSLYTGNWAYTDYYYYNPETFQTTLTDPDASWGPNSLVGLIIEARENMEKTQRVIAANTATTITFWGNIPAGLVRPHERYVIYDYNLQSTSLCIDTGDPDTNGDTIPWDDPDNPDTDDQDPDESRKDMGALPFKHPLYAYVTDQYQGLRIIDVSDPANAIEVGYYIVSELPVGEAKRVYVRRNHAYVAYYDKGLRVIDVSTPDSPSEVGHSNAILSNNLYLNGDYAYLTLGLDGLRIIDISTPSSPTQVGQYDTQGRSQDVYVSGNYAYVVDHIQGLRIIDVSDPANPTETGYYDTQGYAIVVYVSGDYAYVAESEDGLRIINISNPINPAEDGYYDTAGLAIDVYVKENYAYVADGNEGLRIIDVSDPINPTEVGYYDTPGCAFGVYVSY